MGKLKTFKIASTEFNINVPLEANMKFLNTIDTSETKKEVLKLLSKFLPKTEFIISEEEIDTPRKDFNIDLFEEQNLHLLCYLGFSYPRYFKGREVHYCCWFLYEFGGWDLNQNRYFNSDGSFKELEKIK